MVDRRRASHVAYARQILGRLGVVSVHAALRHARPGFRGPIRWLSMPLRRRGARGPRATAAWPPSYVSTTGRTTATCRRRCAGVGGGGPHAATGPEPDLDPPVLRPGAPGRGRRGARHFQRRPGLLQALGYRPEEYEIFGLDLGDRGWLADEKLALLRRLLAGETVVRDGRRIAVTPQPLTKEGPAMMWGGGSLAAARPRHPDPRGLDHVAAQRISQLRRAPVP